MAARVYRLADVGVNYSWSSIFEQLDDPGSFRAENSESELRRMSMKYNNLVAQEEYLIAHYAEALEAMKD